MLLSKEFLVLASVIVSLFMVIVVNFIRIKNTNKPATARKIILPPFFMATGASMFFLPMFRPTSVGLVSAIIMGMLASILLIKTSKFEIRGNQIYLQKSKLFILVLVGFVALRMIGKIVLADSFQIEPAQMSGIFFILAFSMLLPWRIGMYVGFKKLKKQLK